MNASHTCPVLSCRLTVNLFKNWHHLWHPQLHCYHSSIVLLTTTVIGSAILYREIF